ncbi:hypothetical protein [uncultured Deinococcus sp.]|uniref:hypothetical protein n=1 Tax=uncultured Deinococcus sp. TaxID=158789 RepID=UPI0025E0FC55|nr:hypothetical protein [uncultured Deinococcus sp.]
MTGPRKGSRGRGPKKTTAQGRGGITRDTVRPARERRSDAASGTDSGAGSSASGGRGLRKAAQGTGGTGRGRAADSSRATGPGGRGSGAAGGTRAGGVRRAATPGGARGDDSTGAARGSRAGSAGTGSAGTSRAGRGRSEGQARGGGSAGGAARAGDRRPPPKVRKALPELKRVQLDAPAPDTVFVDRDGERLTFPDSNLKRVAARVLTEKRKAWRYRPFAFPLFTDRGHEQTFHFDFYVYDYEDSVIRLILVIPFESREVWDRVGRFKRQYPMYAYELWTPEKLAFLDGPRGRLEF